MIQNELEKTYWNMFKTLKYIKATSIWGCLWAFFFFFHFLSLAFLEVTQTKDHTWKWEDKKGCRQGKVNKKKKVVHPKSN
jgi:hypothetical protein